MPISPEHAAELTECYIALASRVYRYARANLRSNDAEAGDLVQQAFEVATKNWELLREWPEEDRLRFLCTVARCDALDAARRDGTARGKQAELWLATHHPIPDPVDAAAVQLLNERFKKEIAAMPDRQREIARLKWDWDMSNKEIAAALGISDKTVSSHVASARAILRAAQQQLGGREAGASEQGGRDE